MCLSCQSIAPDKYDREEQSCKEICCRSFGGFRGTPVFFDFGWLMFHYGVFIIRVKSAVVLQMRQPFLFRFRIDLDVPTRHLRAAWRRSGDPDPVTCKN
jgi:hypothetical protein